MSIRVTRYSAPSAAPLGLEHLRTDLRRDLSVVAEQAAWKRDNLAEAIRRRPLAVFGACAAIGFVIGFVIERLCALGGE